MLLYRYIEDNKSKKYILKQEIKQYILLLNGLGILGLIMIILPYIFAEPAGSVSIGGHRQNFYAESKTGDYIIYSGLFVLFGSQGIFALLYLLGGGLDMRLDYLKNELNGKKIIKRGGVKSYFNDDEISVLLEK